MQTILKHFNSLNDKDRYVRLPVNVQKNLDRELQESDFKDHHVIGSGSFSEVIWAQYKDHNQPVALKKIEKKILKSKNLVQKVQDEIDVLNSINHQNVIKLYSHFETRKYIYLVQEYANSGTLYKELLRSKDKRLPEDQARRWIIQVLSVLDHIHKGNIIHMDLKSENILLHKTDPSQAASIKICDFGMSNFTDKARKTFGGTIEYLSPEMLTNEPHTSMQQIDIWSVGILIYELLTGKTPFQPVTKEKSTKKQFETIRENILQLKYKFPPGFPETAKDLVTRILQIKGSHRPSLVEIQLHPWITGVYIQRVDARLLERVKQQKKHSLPADAKMDFLYNEKQVERYQQEKQQRRSHVNNQISNYLTPKLFNQTKESGSESSDSGSDNDHKRKLLRQEKKIIDKIEELDEPFGSQLVISQQSSKVSFPDIKVEDCDFGQKLDGKPRIAYCIKTSGIDFDKINPELPTTKIEEFKSKVKLMQTRTQSMSQGNFHRLAENTRQSGFVSLFEREEFKCLSDLNILKKELQTQLDEREHLKVQLDIFSSQKNPNPRDSTVGLFMRQSTVTYQNYDSETKLAYFNLLQSKIPNLKCEHFCLKTRFKDQKIQLIKSQQTTDRVETIKSELQQLISYKGKLKAGSDMLKQDNQKIQDKINYMMMEAKQIETQEKIESHLHELHLKYNSTKTPIDEKPYQSFLETLNLTEFKLRVSNTKGKGQGNVSFDSSFISFNSKSFSTDAIETLMDGISKIKIVGSFLNDSKFQRFNQSLQNEAQDKLRTQEANLTNKFRIKMNELELQYQQQKSLQDNKIEKLKKEIQQNQELIAKKTNLDEQYQEVLHKRNELQNELKKLSPKEAPLKNQIEITEKNIQFIEQQIKTLQNMNRKTLDRH